MNFIEAMQEYHRLKDLYRGKQIDQAEFTYKVNLLRVKDEIGRLWQIGVSSGKWYRYEGETWVEGLPTIAPAAQSATAQAPYLQAVTPQPQLPQPPTAQQPMPAIVPGSPPIPLPPTLPLRQTARNNTGLKIVGMIGGALIVLICLGLAALIVYNISVQPSNPAKQVSSTTTTTTAESDQALATKVSRVDQATPDESQATLSVPATPTLQVNRPAAANGLNARGPWLLFSTDKGLLYAANPNGSSLTKVFNDTYIAPYDLSSSLSPDGIHLALITASDSQGLHGLVLHIITLPNGQEVKAIPLTAPKNEPGPDSGPGDPKFEAIRAITQQENSVAWSPDGKTLAFIGLMSEPSADLYSYSLDNDKVVHLSGGPNQAYYPIWSPDGKYILHFGAASFGTGAGYTTGGVWAAQADNSGIVTLPAASGGGDTVVGWTAVHTFLVYSFNIMCGPTNLRTINIDTLKSTTIINNCFYAVAFDPKSGNILYTSSNVDTSDAAVIPAGTYLLSKGQTSAKKIDENAAADASWNKDGGLFFVKEGKFMVAYDAQGGSVQVPQLDGRFQPVISQADPMRSLWIWMNGAPPNSQLFIGAKEQQTIQVDQGTLSYPTWCPDLSRMFYFGADGLHTAVGPDFKPSLVGPVDGTVDGLIWAGKP